MNVLSRRITALEALPVDAIVWCAHCRDEARRGS
jgi:hypothetical protein